MRINIIKTTLTHLDEIYALEKECFSEPWSVVSIANEINHPNAVCLTAVDESETVVGYASMRAVLDEGYINNIAVMPSFRKRGIGQMLLEELICESKTCGVLALSLEVRSKNQPAILLYQKLGFITCGVRKNFYKYPSDDAYIMWKENT